MAAQQHVSVRMIYVPYISDMIADPSDKFDTRMRDIIDCGCNE
jgi:hypothetical protein